MKIYRFEDLRELVDLRVQFSVVKADHDAVREQLQRLPSYDPTESHADMVEDLIIASELLVIEFNRLRREILTLKLEKLHDQQTARSYPLLFGGTVSDFDGPDGFDPSGGGR